MSSSPNVCKFALPDGFMHTMPNSRQRWTGLLDAIHMYGNVALLSDAWRQRFDSPVIKGLCLWHEVCSARSNAQNMDRS